MDTLEMSDKVD